MTASAERYARPHMAPGLPGLDRNPRQAGGYVVYAAACSSSPGQSWKRTAIRVETPDSCMVTP